MLRGNLWAWECPALTCAELVAACRATARRVLPLSATQLQEACFCRVRGPRVCLMKSKAGKARGFAIFC